MKSIKQRIVTIGGGSGQSTLLAALKQYPVEIKAVVSMVDDGGSTGKLREELGALPMGDVRRCLVALAQSEPRLQDLMNYRFTTGSLAGHVVGNIMLAGLEQQKNFTEAVASVSSWLNTAGQVLPVTTELTSLEAILESGLLIHGETNIDVPKHDPTLAIQNIHLSQAVTANPAVLSALAEADMIVLTIGDLYTSIIPNLLVTGVAEAIAKSKAKLVYTCNRTTKWGETNHYSALDYVTTLEKYLAGRKINTIVISTTATRDGDRYAAITVDQTALQKHGLAVVAADLGDIDGKTISGEKLAKEIFQLCQR